MLIVNYSLSRKKLHLNLVALKKVILKLQESRSKDSTSTPNPLPMKITKTTQSCREDAGKLKGATLSLK